LGPDSRPYGAAQSFSLRCGNTTDRVAAMPLAAPVAMQHINATYQKKGFAVVDCFMLHLR
jgi:hypothetical protein